MRNLWIYAWAYVYVALGLLDRLGDWMADQIDHNDYLAGVLFVLVLFEMVWFAGIINVTFAGVR